MLSSTQDLLYLVGAICILWITAFLCWCLYEAGKLVHQANAVIKDGREKLSRFEKSVAAVGEKLANVSQYLGFIAEGGRQLISLLHKREKKRRHAEREGE